jgi:hypothetical protein
MVDAGMAFSVTRLTEGAGGGRKSGPTVQPPKRSSAQKARDVVLTKNRKIPNS